MLQVLSRILLIFCILLLVINVFAYILFSTADEPVTFTSVLHKLDNAPTIDFTLKQSIDIFQIEDDWSILNPIKTIINALGAVLGLLVWIASLLVNLVIFVGYAFYLLGLQSFSAYV